MEPEERKVARGAARVARRAARRRRRLAGALALLAPFLFVLTTDLLRRARQIAGYDRLHLYGYLGGLAESAVFWGVLVYVAGRRRGAVARATGALFVALFTIALGVEGAFYSFWATYLSLDGQIHSKNFVASIFGVLPVVRSGLLVHLAIALVFASLTLVAARHVVRPRRLPRLLAPLLVPVVLVAVTRIPVSYRRYLSSPPDVMYFHGLTGLAKELLGFTHDSPDRRVERRDPEPVPPLTRAPKRPRNVLLILGESQRADVTCIEHDPDCALATRASNAAAPNRLPLRQLRALDSTTAISISNLWSGLLPTESRALLHSAPLVWEYAAAAGYDTAYWTSQHVMFGNARLYVQDLPVSHRAVATHLDPEADLDAGALDRLATERVVAEWGELREPFFAVVHYSNVHYPYVYDPDHAPFQPAEMSKAPEKNEEFLNYYRNVVYLSDLAVGELIRHVRASESGPRTVIVYTSDHGESFREHWQMGHTSSLYDEEVHVPGWIDAPEGTLAPEEEASVRGAKDALVSHLDLATTMLDLLGIWDDPALSPFRARMMGHPLTRPERTVRPLPMTNCTWVWECSFRNWGMMLGPLKLEAREWDGEYHCFHVLDDPDELHNLGERACGPLADLARALHPSMPNVTPPGRPEVNWGK
jgi:glucan phosphoethanolaminetransferase (alkaline phosphatase superfamily)